MKKLFIATALAALTGCASQKASLSDAMTHEWSIDKIDGMPLGNKSETAPFIGIDVDQRRVYGNAGCNSLTGALKVEGDASKGTIDLSQTGMTRMMCADMETEDRIVGAIARVRGYRLAKNILILTDGDGKPVMEMSLKGSR